MTTNTTTPRTFYELADVSETGTRYIVQGPHPRYPAASLIVPSGTRTLYAGGGGPTGRAHARPTVIAGDPEITLRAGATYPSGTTTFWHIAFRPGDVIRVGEDEVWACDAQARETYRLLRKQEIEDNIQYLRGEIERAHSEGWHASHTKWRKPSLDESLEQFEKMLATVDA